jgi:hypothetical protein
MLSYPAKGGAGPDDHGDPDAGQVLGPFQAVGVSLGRRPPGQPEAEEHHGAGGDVGQVVDRVSQQPDRAGHDRKKQLDDTGGGQPDGADGDGTVGIAPVLRIITQAGQRKGNGRVTYPGGLVHPLRMAGRPYGQQTRPLSAAATWPTHHHP